MNDGPIILDENRARYIRRRLADLDALLVKVPNEGPLDPPTHNHWNWREELRGTVEWIRKVLEGEYPPG